MYLKIYIYCVYNATYNFKVYHNFLAYELTEKARVLSHSSHIDKKERLFILRQSSALKFKYNLKIFIISKVWFIRACFDNHIIFIQASPHTICPKKLN